jgi:hypothetical protein
MAKSVKKAQLGTIKKIANTKLSDVPQKAKNVAKKVVNKAKSTTVGDAVDIATQGGYTLAKDAYRRVKGSIGKQKTGGKISKKKK